MLYWIVLILLILGIIAVLGGTFDPRHHSRARRDIRDNKEKQSRGCQTPQKEKRAAAW